MAQTGFTPILTYGSSTASAVPSAGSLTTSAAGVELALNYTDGKLFYKDNGGSVQVLATKGTGAIGGSTTQVQYNLSGSLAGSANMTFDGTRLTVADFADSSLTSGRVPYATTGGSLIDSANLTFNGTTLSANTLSLTNALGTTSGGTGLTSFTSGGAVYATSTSALTTGTLPIASGGTGQTTASAALNALGGINTGKAIAMSMIFGG